MDDGAVGQRHSLPMLEQSALAAVRDAEPVRGFDVEAARTLALDERVAEAGAAVMDGEGHDRVFVPLQLFPGPQLDDFERVRQRAEDAAKGAEQRLQPAGAVHAQGHLATAEGERLQHAGQPEIVVGVEMGDEDLLHVDEADARSQQLALGSLGAVEQEPVAAAPDECRGRRALRRRRRACRAQEDDVEVHLSSQCEIGVDHLAAEEPRPGSHGKKMALRHSSRSPVGSCSSHRPLCVAVTRASSHTP